MQIGFGQEEDICAIEKILLGDLNKMNVCILSMQDVQNFGSLLQSYALKKILENLGYVVDFIPIEPITKDNEMLEGMSDCFAFETGKANAFGKLKKIDKYAFNRIKIRQKSLKQGYKFDEFRTEKLYKKNKEEKFDYCIIGSDEVFNCCTKSAWGFTSQLFGNVKQATKVITYAASCGTTETKKLPAKVKNKIKLSLQKVQAISVRDENTKKFVIDILGKIPEINLDPVLIYDFSKELRQLNSDFCINEKYCIVYSYYNRINKKEEIDAIKKFCNLHDLKIISVGAPQMWIKHYYVCEPFQMLKLFQNASFVITDTFHGTIFSAKYCEKFATLVKDSNRNKLQDLIDRLHLSAHQIRNMGELENTYNIVHNKDEFANIINIEQARSITYFVDQLQ